MTQLQILRALLQYGATVTLSRQEDGYHVAIEGVTDSGTPYAGEAMDPRLDQAINEIAVKFGLLPNNELPTEPLSMEEWHARLRA